MGKKLSKINNPWVIEAITILVGLCMIAIFYFIEQICGSSRDTVWSVRYLQPFTIASMLVGECMKYYYAGEEECRNIWHIHCILAVVLAVIYVIVVNVTGINVLDVLWLAYAIVIFFGVTSWYMMLSGKASSKVNIAVTNMTFVTLFFYLQEVFYWCYFIMSLPVLYLVLVRDLDIDIAFNIAFAIVSSIILMCILFMVRLPKLKYFTMGLGLSIMWGIIYRCDIILHDNSDEMWTRGDADIYMKVGMAVTIVALWIIYLIINQMFKRKVRMQSESKYLSRMLQDEKPIRIVIKLSIFVVVLIVTNFIIIKWFFSGFMGTGGPFA